MATLFTRRELAYQIADNVTDRNREWRKKLIVELRHYPPGVVFNIMLRGFAIYDRRVAKAKESGRASANKGKGATCK